jgi:hypothetical protein
MLTNEQIRQNIVALQQQGATDQDVQAYLSSLGAAPVAPPETQSPNIFNWKAAGDVFTQAGKDVQTSQQLQQQDQGFMQQLGGALQTGATMAIQGGLSPFRALGAGFASSYQGEHILGSAIEGMTKFGDVITPQSIQEKIGDIAMTSIAGYEMMTPEEQLKMRNRLGFAEALTYLVGTPAAGTAVKTGAGAVEGVVKAGAKKIIPTKANGGVVESLVKSFQKSFIDNNPGMTSAFEKLATKWSRGTTPMTTTQLFKDMVLEGVFPKVNGKLASFTDSIGDLTNRQSRIGTAIDKMLEGRPEVTDLSVLKSEAAKILADTPGIDFSLAQNLKQLDNFFEGIALKTQRNPDFTPGKLNPKQLNQTRINMNKKTRAYAGETFSEDVADAIANAVRRRLDEIEPNVRKYNEDWARLQRVKAGAKLLNNRPINVGVLGSQMGRLIASTALGASGLASGSASLVIAGIVAHFGGEWFAKMLRNSRFSPATKKAIIQALKENPSYARQMIEETTGKSKAILVKEILDSDQPVEFETLPITDNTVKPSFNQGETPPTTGGIKNFFQERNAAARENLTNRGEAGFAKLLPEGKQQRPIITPKSSSLKDSINKLETSGIEENEFRVGITNVAGLQKTKSDAIFAQAKSALARGDKEEAKKLYNESVQFGIQKIKDTFKDTGITVKAKPGLGIFEAVPEASIDMVAIVPAKKVDFFHYQLSKLAGGQFAQKSVITSGRAKGTNLGWVDKARGVSNEPVARFTLTRELGIDETEEILKLMNDNGLFGASIVNNGKAIDIINLSHYNSNYEGFTQSVTRFAKALDEKKILGDVEDGISEVRHFGSDSGNGPTTYRAIQNDFESKNPGLKVSGRYQTAVTEALPKKNTYYKKEIENILKRDTISPTEKEMMFYVLQELPDSFTYKELDTLVTKYLLKTQPNKLTQYASYGLDNMPHRDAETTLFRTPISHGQSGHFGTADDFGHMRTFKDSSSRDPNIYISEIQADAFQRGIKAETKESLLNKIERNKDEISELDGLNAKDSVKTLERQIAEYERQIKVIEDPKYQAQLKQLKSYESGNKYRKRLLQEALFEASRKGDAVAVPTPSTVAKFEWGRGNADNMAPYEVTGNATDDLIVGDEVGYMGEPYQVVDVSAQGRGWGGPPPTQIGIVPEDKVIFKTTASEYIQGEVDGMIETAQADIRKILPNVKDKLTESDLGELSSASGNMDVPEISELADNLLEARTYVDGPGSSPFEGEMTIDQFEDLLRNDLYERFQNFWYDDLRGAYGDDRVFVSSKGYEEYIVVTEEVPEYFGQPSSYDFIDPYELMGIDFDKEAAKKIMSPTEMGVLNNYYEYQNILKQFEKEWDMDIDWGHQIDDDYGNPTSFILVNVPKGFRIKP